MEVPHHLQDLDVVAFLVLLPHLQDKTDGIRLQDLAEAFIRVEMAGKDDSMLCGRLNFLIVRVSVGDQGLIP
jgi:hypothetical protein